MDILIIEDEAVAAHRLEKLLKTLVPDLHVPAVLESVERSVRWLKEHPQPDLILMDIQLADGSSFGIFSRTPVTAPVIFITAYDEYALQAFKANGIEYLLKPVEKDELCKALEKFRRLTHFDERAPQPDTARMPGSPHTAAPNYKTRFLVRYGAMFITVFTREIAYFFSDHKVTYMLTRDAKKHIVDQTLEELEDQLDPKTFFRLNRQFIASIDSITRLHTFLNRKLKVELTPRADVDVLVSRERSPEFKTWLNE